MILEKAEKMIDKKERRGERGNSRDWWELRGARAPIHREV